MEDKPVGPPNVMINPVSIASDTRFASRKFIVTCIVLIISTTLILNKYIDASVFADISKWVLGLYMTGNEEEKVGLAVKV